MTNVKDFLRYLRSVKSAMLIDTAGSLFVLLLGVVMYATQTYEPMLPIISLVGIQFIVSGYMVMSKIKNFSEEFCKNNITNFKDQTAKITRYYMVKMIIFIIPLLTFLLSKIGLVTNQVCFFTAMGAYLAFMLISLCRHIRIRDFITSLCEYTSE